MARKSLRRIVADEHAAAEEEEEVVPPACWLCGRPLGQRVEWHHPVPKSRKGRGTVAVHPICHRTIHAHFDNKTLAAIGEDRDRLTAFSEMAAFLRWIADKPPDFHTATRRAKSKGEPWNQKGRR